MMGTMTGGEAGSGGMKGDEGGMLMGMATGTCLFKGETVVVGMVVGMIVVDVTTGAIEPVDLTIGIGVTGVTVAGVGRAVTVLTGVRGILVPKA